MRGVVGFAIADYSDDWREDGVRLAYSPELERLIGNSLFMGMKVLGMNETTIYDLAYKAAGKREGRKKSFSLPEKREYLGYMSLLASRDYSVLKEVGRPRIDSPRTVDWVRRSDSNHRLSHRKPFPTPS